jgi:hypothetical protein
VRLAAEVEPSGAVILTRITIELELSASRCARVSWKNACQNRWCL